jgi:anti-anti-sigma regulatory factor
MIQLYNNKSGELIGEITEQQLQFLEEQLEEESTQDRDYAIDPMTLAYFESLGAEKGLVDLLRSALAGQAEIIIRWTKS